MTDLKENTHLNGIWTTFNRLNELLEKLLSQISVTYIKLWLYSTLVQFIWRV